MEKHIEMNATSKLFKHTSLNNNNNNNQRRKKKAFMIQHTHTHTHTHTLNKSNQFYISKISYDSLLSIHQHTYSLWWPNHIVLAHVSKVAKNLRVVCENIARVHMCLILWRFEIWENHIHSHTIIIAWWGLSFSRYIL